YFRVGKNMMKFHLNLLSTKTFGADIDTGTNVTMCRLGNRITAIMTFQHIISFVISQTDITVGALWYMPTAQAFHHGRKSTSVLKQNNLFAFCQNVFHFFNQMIGKMSGHLFFLLSF